MSEPNASSPAPVPGKYTRYRSVRHAPAKAPPPEEPVPVRQEKGQDAGTGAIGRAKSMSRYRKSRIGGGLDQHDMPPPMPTMPTTSRRVTDPMPSASRPMHVSKDDKVPVRKSTFPARQETEDERLRRKVLEFREREARKEKLEEEKRVAEEEKRNARHKAEEEARAAKKRKTKAEAEATKLRLEEEETARLLAEQKRKDLERLEATLAAAPPKTPSVTSPREKFSFFRKRAASKPPAPPIKKAPKPTSPPSRRVARDPIKLARPLAPEQTIQEGGGGIVPQTDAPISASNAGERRVLIRCKQSSINLPVDVETTSVDILFSAANIMTQNIVPSTAILLESYTQLGLERRIRRYEHIRDIMNSWDRDTQNAFVVVNSESPQFDTDLEASPVPKEAPDATTVYMYHSQKPGKWNKRYITLLPTGQIYMSKKPFDKSSEKDNTNLCHLSDFDIYSSTPSQTRKVLKPPKKHCYAIKSQQKTTMFLDTGNFVHYFSIDDETIANRWYDAVQEWRSWYLVRQRGEGAKKKKRPMASQAEPSRTHRTKISLDESPYTIGTFSPLLDMDRFDNPQNEYKDREYDSDEGSQPRQVPFHLRNSVSLSPIPARRGSKRHPPPVSYRLPPEAEEEFASGGLLGRSYSQRHKAQAQKDRDQPSYQGPFVDGPSLLNNTVTSRPERTMSMRSTRTAKRPQTSVEPAPGLPKPLLDFAPVFKEAPQWDKKGRGHGVKPVAGMPLVENATTPEEALNALTMQPTPTIFRRDQEVPRPKTSARPKTAKEGPFVGGGLVQGAGFVKAGGGRYD
ncbi:hypothetical protein BJ875DRAFT_377586 [Amylocarpus encephaloides]|uniref:PH domain-containing protein n=1 Tax=Amylocarpus encephaloides TaxID=45428 RepID=A0A9P8C4W2_9HELO|nr:hypothetical protein BJ875DRAFT_377586 [Amylocarpus encephaloides]